MLIPLLNLLPILLFIAELLSIPWVFMDANRIRLSAKERNPGWVPLDPIGWSMLCFFFWAIAFPLYLFKRVEIRGEIGRRNDIYDKLPDDLKWR